MSWAQYIPMAVDIGMSLFSKESNSALQSYLYSKLLQEHQYDLNRKTRQTAFQDTRYSLEQADYNPILAVGQQAQGGNFGASLNVQDPKTENLQNRLNTMTALSSIKLNSAQAYNQAMQGKLTTAQANNLNTQSQLNSANTAVANLQADAQKITNKYLPDTLSSGIKRNVAESQALLVNAEANRVSAMANQMNAQTNQMVGQSQAWRNRNQSLGYSTSVHMGPFSMTHTGNPNLYTQGTQGNGPVYKTEYINGKPIQVRIIR